MAGSKIINIMQEMAKIPDSESTDLLVGRVTSVSPLKVQVDNRYELDSDFLVLTSLVQDFEVYMTVDHTTEVAELHSHEYKGRKKFKVHLALTVGEKVLLLRVQNGQKFIIIDRVR